MPRNLRGCQINCSRSVGLGGFEDNGNSETRIHLLSAALYLESYQRYARIILFTSHLVGIGADAFR